MTSLSQEALADLCEMDRSYLGAVERGEYNIALVNIIKICDALDASMDELTTWFGTGGAELSPEILQGKCCAPLRSVGAEKLSELLRQAV